MISAKENNTDGYRTASVKFKAGTAEKVINVKQAPRGAIVLAQDEYRIGQQGGPIDFEILTNIEVVVTIPEDCSDWITRVETRTLEPMKLCFDIAPCDPQIDERVGYITIRGGEATQVVKVIQGALVDKQQLAREILVEFYEATGGDNWKYNGNWCSDLPIDQWYGVFYNAEGHLIIQLYDNNLSGIIPESICNLTDLSMLQLSCNSLTGQIPDNIGNLQNLQTLSLGSNHLEGRIPEGIGNLQKLQYLSLSANHLVGLIPECLGNLQNLQTLSLGSNYLTGQLPESLGNLSKLTDINLQDNQLGGEVSDKIKKAEWFPDLWEYTLSFNKFDNRVLPITAPEFSNVITIDGEVISDDVYAENTLTFLFYVSRFSSSSNSTLKFLSALKELEDIEGASSLKTLVYSNFENSDLDQFMETNGVEWDAFSTIANAERFKHQSDISSVHVVDNAGNIVFTTRFDDHEDFLVSFVWNYLGVAYESTDFSSNGVIEVLQEATEGNGIDVVIMGDAFTDKDIADGTYDKVMSMVCEKFFVKEPYKSFRDYFNVYSVKVVSKHGRYGPGMETAFSCKFKDNYGPATLDHAKTWIYVNEAVSYSDSRAANAVAIVVMNTTERDGVCVLLEPYESTDWSPGFAVAMVSRCENDDDLEYLVNHEANGHGFAKLADEYSYVENGSIPIIEQYRLQAKEEYGWWKNIDFTNDPSLVKWARFLHDERYKNDGLGVFEGGNYYPCGVWRATECSIMKSTEASGFNAPSREAIYYRIHKLAYGEEWEYDYEEFVKWDAKNRKTEPQARSRSYVLDIHRNPLRLHPPIIISTDKDIR
jgi:hypothetical protein